MEPVDEARGQLGSALLGLQSEDTRRTRRTVVVLALFALVALGVMRQYVSHMKQSVAASRSKFEPVCRAGNAVEAAPKIDANYFEFREMVQNFGLEVSIAQKNAETPEEQALASLYASALEAYQDSLTIWEKHIDAEGFVRVGMAERDYILVTSDHVEPIVHRYRLTTKPWQFRVRGQVSRYEILHAGYALREIWSHASVKLSEANAARNSLAIPTWMEWVP